MAKPTKAQLEQALSDLVKECHESGYYDKICSSGQAYVDRAGDLIGYKVTKEFLPQVKIGLPPMPLDHNDPYEEVWDAEITIKINGQTYTNKVMSIDWDLC